MNESSIKKIPVFGLYWISLLAIFLSMLFGTKRLVLFFIPDYSFSKFWGTNIREFDAPFILMIFTVILSILIAKRAFGIKETLKKIGSFGICWAASVCMVAIAFFGAKKYILLNDPDYIFSGAWSWDWVGIITLIFLAFSAWVTGFINFLVTGKLNGKKQ